MKTITLLLALAFAARAQYATSANPNAGGAEMNTKPAWQIVAGAPTSLNCTQGKDFAYDTTNNLQYYCKTTGTPGTWAQIPVLAVGGALSGTLPNPTLAANAVVTASITNANVTSAKQSVEPTRREICIPVGANNGSALADADLGPQAAQYFLPFAGTLVEMQVRADGGTPQVILGRDRAGTIVNAVSAALATAASGAFACSNAGGTTSINGSTACSATLQNTSWNVGDGVPFVSGTAGGTAKQMTACLVFVTVN